MIKFLGKKYIVDILEINNFVSIKKDADKEDEMSFEIEETYQLGEVQSPPKKGKKSEVVNDLIKTMEVVRYFQRGKEIDVIKYDMIKVMIDTLLTENEEVDENLGEEIALGKYSASFKFAFNTLLYYKILKPLN